MGLKDEKSLRPLTQRQETFCRSIVQGSNQSDAYREAYSTENKAVKTVHEAASRLMTDSKVLARLVELRAPAVKKTQATYAEWLENVQRMAMFDPQILLDDSHPLPDAMALEVEIDKDGNRTIKYKPGAKLSALELFGKAVGHYVEKAPVQSPLESAATETLVEMLKEVRERRKARREAEQPIEINPLATVTTYSSTPLGGS